MRQETEGEDYFSGISTGGAAFVDIERLSEELGSVNNRQSSTVNQRLETTNVRVNELLKACKSLSGQLSSIVTDVGRAANRMVDERLGAMEEELNMLWWLFGEQSRKMEKPFVEMGAAEMVLVASDELAEKTTQIPGPPSTEDLLGKALLISNGGDAEVLKKAVTFKAFAESAESDWREKRAAQLESHVVTPEDFAPVLYSVAAADEVGGDEWTAYYERKTGVEAATSMEALDLAVQAYNEALLLRIA